MQNIWNVSRRYLYLVVSKCLYLRALTLKRVQHLRVYASLFILHGNLARTGVSHGEEAVMELIEGNFLSSHGMRVSKDTYKLWHQANYYFGRGEYWKSVELRILAMEKIYESQDISSSKDYYPKLVSSSYTVAIGHLGALHLNNVAQRIGIAQQGPRYVITGRRVANQAALNFVAENTLPVGTFDPSGLLTVSSLIENYQIVKCSQGFMDRFQLWEAVYESLKQEKDLSIQSTGVGLPVNLESGKDLLRRMGLNLDRPIALIHLRNNGNSKESRNVDATTYVNSVSFLQDKGYQVCQIGVNKSNSLGLLIKGVFTVPHLTRQDREANFYLLKDCDLFIGTTSGPAIFPTILGRPSLITNLTSLSRNAFSSKSTLYLPKKIELMNGKQLSLAEQLSSRFSFGGEFLVDQLTRGGVSFRDNSSQEIVEALDELLSRLSKGVIESTSCDKAVREMQDRFNTVAKGQISNSFLRSNEMIS